MDGIIVHNDIMKNVLAGQGFPSDKMVSLEVFDYLIPNFEVQALPQKTNLVAGNLNLQVRLSCNFPEQPAITCMGRL